MNPRHSHARDRSAFRLTLSAALFLAAGVALVGQAETAAPAQTQVQDRAWHSPASTGPAPAGAMTKAPCRYFSA